MILYFSGTGNSRLAAEMIASISDDDVLSIGTRIKSGDKSEIKSEKPLVFVCPVYAGRIPKVAEDNIKQTTFTGTKKAYFIATCAQTPWATIKYVEKLCKEKGFILVGFNSVVMPQGYIAAGNTKPKEDNDKVLSVATPKIKQMAELIKDRKPLPDEIPGKAMMSDVLNPILSVVLSSTKPFHTTTACNSCGMCVQRCPMNNVKLENKKPVWGKDCTLCMACIGGCPACAIEYGKKSVGKTRYYNTDSADSYPG